MSDREDVDVTATSGEPGSLSLPVLPEGVSTVDWALERNQWQNPRIRGLLRCMKILDGVTESNYSILHCSVKRLFEVWEHVRKVLTVLRSDLAPFLTSESSIPALDVARMATAAGLANLESSLFKRLESVPEAISVEHVATLRRTLCTALEELSEYVKNTLSVLVANDPRSQFDADYFLSKRFSRDVDEAEWLFSSVNALEEYVDELSKIRGAGLTLMVESLKDGSNVPTQESWKLTGHILKEILETLVPMMRTVAVIPGTRLNELESLENMTSEISARCWISHELFDLGCKTAELTDRNADDDTSSDAYPSPVILVICDRLRTHLQDIDQQLRDLAAFVVIWGQGISQRRALLLTRDDHLDEAPR